jgi:hypothetical protein
MAFIRRTMQYCWLKAGISYASNLQSMQTTIISQQEKPSELTGGHT